MADSKRYHPYTTADFARYFSGEMSAEERRALELAAADDPFLSDALAGYENQSLEEANDASHDLHSRLSKRIADKGSKKQAAFFYWRVAAAVVLLVGLGWLSFQWMNNSTNSSVAETEKILPKEQIKDSSETSGLQKGDSVAEKTGNSVVNQSPVLPSADPAKEVPVNKTEGSTATADLDTETAKKALSETGTAPLDIPAAAAEPNPSDDFVNSERNSSGYAKISEKKKEAARSVAVGPARKINPDQDATGVRSESEVQKSMLRFDTVTGLRKLVHFTGLVLDNEGNPLPYANVTSVKEQVGTYANLNGKFSLIAPDSVLEVQIKSVGFLPKRVPLTAANTTKIIRLIPDTLSVKDIVLQKDKPRIIRTGAPVTINEPEPDGGWGSYDDYVANNLNVPESYRRKPELTGGMVELSFELDTQGKPINIKVEKSLCQTCDREAIRLLKEGPKWIRKARGNGRMKVSISF